MISKHILDHYEIEHVAEYVRKSRATKDMTEEETLQNHKIRMDRFVKEFHLTADIFAEIGTSVKIDQRLEFMDLLTQIDRGNEKYDAILVVEVDRLTRSNGDFERVADVLSYSDVKLIVEGEGRVYDLNNSADVQMLKFRVFGASLEYEYTKHRLLQGRKESARQGNFIGSIAPIGYKYDRDTKRLVIEPTEAIIVRKMYKLYLEERLSYRKIAARLNSMGHRTHKGKLFSDNHVLRIMERPVYIGDLVWNKTRTRYTSQGVTIKQRDKAEWLVTPDAHEPIIDKDTYNRFVKEREKRKREYKRHKDFHPLKGLVVCPHCGRILPISYKKLKNRTQAHIKRCQNHDMTTGKLVCQHAGQNLDGVMKQISDELKNYSDSLVVNADKIVRDLLDKQSKNDGIESKHLVTIVKEKENLEAKVNKLFEYLESEVITPADFKKRRDVHQERIDLLEQEIAELDTDNRNDLLSLSESEIKARVRFVEAHARKTINNLPHVNKLLQREIVLSFIDRIVHHRVSRYVLGTFDFHLKDNLILSKEAIRMIAQNIQEV